LPLTSKKIAQAIKALARVTEAFSAYVLLRAGANPS
jgi:hypothetical protein